MWVRARRSHQPGAVTGLVVSGLNHAMHEMDEPGKRKLVKPDSDGKLTKSEADAYYQSGKKGTLNKIGRAHV